jgi:predicted transcriptional regulator
MAEIPYTVRLAPDLLERIERIARARGTTPRRLVRAVLAERFGGERAAHPDGAAAESSHHRTLDQILFDLTRTRLTLQHLLDNQVGSEITDQIRQTAQAEAERYMQRLTGRRWS